MLVGAAASGKTTLRRALLVAGLPAERVVSLDDLRRALRDADVAAGREVRALQAYTLSALRWGDRLRAALLARGVGYLLDATSLRRSERVAHVRAAHAAGLPAVALLLPRLPLAELAARNARREPDEVVPDDVLAAHAHRHGLLDAALLRAEGFDVVLEVARRVRAGAEWPGREAAGRDEPGTAPASPPPALGGGPVVR